MRLSIIGNLHIFPLISPSAMFSINELKLSFSLMPKNYDVNDENSNVSFEGLDIH